MQNKVNVFSRQPQWCKVLLLCSGLGWIVMVQTMIFGTYNPHAAEPASNVHITGVTLFLFVCCKCWHRPTLLRKDLRLLCVAMPLFQPYYLPQ